jgi:hypothetical protein
VIVACICTDMRGNVLRCNGDRGLRRLEGVGYVHLAPWSFGFNTMSTGLFEFVLDHTRSECGSARLQFRNVQGFLSYTRTDQGAVQRFSWFAP